MPYFLYENWRAGPHKAVLHDGACRFCKGGRGLRGGTDPKHGKWHEPFLSLQDARTALGRMRVDLRIEHTCIYRSSP